VAAENLIVSQPKTKHGIAFMGHHVLLWTSANCPVWLQPVMSAGWQMTGNTS